MAETTPFTIGAQARCTDGVCGKVSRVVVDPVAKTLTHLVVEPTGREGLGRLVPLDLVDAAPDEVRLRCTIAEFDDLESAEDTQFVPGSGGYAAYGPEQLFTWPYYGLGGAGEPSDIGGGLAFTYPTVTYDAVPLGEVAVHRDDPVHATDGNIGRVQGLVIEPGSHHVTHVLLQEGHLWGRKEVAIPIKAVAEVSDEGIKLNIAKREVEDLPPVDIEHPDGAGQRPRGGSSDARAPTDTGRPVAVVTGANRGIGREIARQLAGHGYAVVLGSRDLPKGERAARQLDPAGQDILACALDVASPDSVEAMAGWVTERLGRADVLINNAAIHYDTWQRAEAADLGIVADALETNLLGAWRTTQALLPLLRRSPHPRIVNVSTESGSISEMTGGTPAYSVSKAALNALTRLLAGELRRDRILVNAICPGWTATDMGGGGGRPVTDGAASVVWGALLPDDGPTGGFYRDGGPLPW